ncbi:pyridoxamine 5'-phosphate oxidase family protein [Pseudomonadota bacterium]
MPINNPYHEGELAVQQRANEADMARMNSGALADAIPAGALRFIAQQPMVVAGSIDSLGRVWASVLFGQPGFIHALDNQTLELDLSQPRSAKDDPLWTNVGENPNVGLLSIELGSRRRLRVNGRMAKASEQRYLIDVETAYPNCPKYIQRRQWKAATSEAQFNASSSTQGSEFNDRQRALITTADTFFVASAHPERGVDASHRGGHAGFVHFVNDRQLRIPDFAGNSMFNTLGNIASYPYAGLVFIDFERGRLLQLTGKAEILWDIDDPTEETGGTRRYWQFDLSAWQESTLPFHLEWEFMDYSPHIPEIIPEPTQQAFSTAPVNHTPTTNILELKVERIQNETSRIKSFRLCALEGGLLPAFQPGTHLQVKVRLPSGQQANRHYSLLSDPNDRQAYKIGVLAEPSGRGGSLYMHQQLHEGDVIECRVPKNDFPMAASASHTILIAGGIGITPMLSMMHKLAAEQQSFEMHYSGRTYSSLAFRDTIEKRAGDRAHFYASSEPDGRRLELSVLLSMPKAGTHVYVCGPHGLINAVRETAAALGWPPAQIHFESFGVQSLPDDKPIELHLARSNKQLTVPAEQTILDTLLGAGINVPHDCKRGECSMCTTQVLEGEVDHRDLCLSSDEKETSMCLCVSRVRGGALKLDL